MITTLKKFLALPVVFALVFVFSPVAHASPPVFVQATSTAAATSTLIFQTPGTATTSLIYDSSKYGGLSDINGALYFGLNLQYTASTSAGSILGFNVETANSLGGADCSANQSACDWYGASILGQKALDGTTTQAFDISTSTAYRLTFASTSQGALAMSGNLILSAVRIPIFSRFTRINFYQIGTKNGAIWAEAIGIKNRF